MKKLLVISILALGLVFATSPANAQMNIGVKGGVSFAKTAVSGGGISVSSSTTTGFLGGVYTSFELGSGLMVQPEVLYVQKGAENNNPIGGGTRTTSLDYIEIPVLAKYGFSTGGSFTPYVAAGPYLAFNMNAEVEQGGNTTDISDSVKGTDFGLSGEVGADISGFNIGVRYDLGLTGINESTGSGFAGGADTKNRAFFITAGYSF